MLNVVMYENVMRMQESFFHAILHIMLLLEKREGKKVDRNFKKPQQKTIFL